jgi:hypothetical protein
LGFKFLLLGGLANPMCFLADHGNVVWRAGLTSMGSKTNEIANLLGKARFIQPLQEYHKP